MSLSSSHRRPERGAELIEMAFVFSALMALVFGIMSFARAYNIYQTMTRATREGVREAVLPTAASAGNQLTYITSDSSCPAAPTNSPSTTIFTDFISPALQASGLNPGLVQNYEECLTWLDPSSTSSSSQDPDAQCGVQVTFQYPVELNIPFFPQTISSFNVSTTVQMRLENQEVTTVGGLPAYACGSSTT